MTISAQITLVNRFSQLQGSIPISIDEGLAQAGEYIVQLASELAPEETGALKASGRSEVQNHVLSVSFGNGLSDIRAIAQEHGTVYMPAQPFLMPAVREIDVAQEIALALTKHLL